MASPANPPPQLMKLGQAEALGIFNHHYCGIGHVDADFHYSCRNQHLDFPGSKTLHNLIFLFSLHLSVKIFHSNGFRQLLT